MSIVIHGENISKDGTSQYVFKPTSKQVNALNDLCYGRLNTPLRSVQFNFNCDQDLLAGCYIDYQTYSIAAKTDKGFTLKIDGVERLTFLRAFYSISQFYSYLQQSSKKQFIYEKYTFEQGFQYDETLLQQGYVSLSYYVQCVASTDGQWPVSRINMDTQMLSGLQPGRPPYLGVVIHGENLIRMLGLDELSPNLQKYTQPYHDEHLNIDVNPLITSKSKDGRVQEYTINYYAGNITQNFLAFAPVWWIWQDYIEQPEQSITRDGVTYTVQTHYDWRRSFYIEGLKYKYTQWKNRETNEEFNPLVRYPDDLGLFQVYGTQAYFLQIYHYLLFHSPELAIENYADERGKKYNIISKSINNTNPNQYFQMSTTEAIRKLTLQNIASIEIHMNIYDQDFTLTKAYKQPLMILTFDRLREQESVLQDLRKTFDGTNLSVQQQ